MFLIKNHNPNMFRLHKKNLKAVLTQVALGPDGAILMWMFPPRPYPLPAPIDATDFWAMARGRDGGSLGLGAGLV